MIIDSHCHLISYKYSPDEIDDIIQRALDAGVTQMITLATSLEDCKQHLNLTEKHTSVFAAIGIHPCDVHQTSDTYLEPLSQYARHSRCVAIGETGLDYFHPAPEGWNINDYHKRQREFLEQHFALAAELDKNIVIHTRDRSGKLSMEHCLDIYSKWNDKVQAVFHCFPGPVENAYPIFDLGGLVSFTGIATFKSAQACLESATKIPAGSFMLETDSPYLAPTPHRGKRCEPAHTAITAAFIAEARNETYEKLAAHTTETAKKFYKI